MVRFPGARWVPFTHGIGGKRKRTDFVNYHVAASNAPSLQPSLDRNGTSASCHLYVRKDGSVEQYADLDVITWTSAEGNARSIGVETQGVDGEPWTQAQLETCAEIARFCAETYGFPLRLMESSRPHEQGIGCHRLGVRGDFPDYPSIHAGVEQRRAAMPGDHESWSGVIKTCPGDERVEQMPTLLALAIDKADDTTKEKDMPKRRISHGGSPVGGRTRVSEATFIQTGKELQDMGFRVQESLAFPPLDMYAHSQNSDHYAMGGKGAFDINAVAGGVNNTRLERYLLDQVVVPHLRKRGFYAIIWQPRKGIVGGHTTWVHAGRSTWGDFRQLGGWTAADKKAGDAWLARHGSKSGSVSGLTPTVLELGDTGSQVKLLQHHLNAVGAKVDVDGSFGPATEKALKAFQKREKLTVDGIYGPNAQAKMDSKLPEPLAVDGSLGPKTIKAWQQWMDTPVDGEISEPSTLIRKVQESLIRRGHKIEADGLLGPKTQAALRKHYNNKDWVRGLQSVLNTRRK